MVAGSSRLTRLNPLEWLGELRHDAAFALRQLIREPGFALVVVVTLTLGLGGAAAIFSLLRRVVLSPLPFPEPERIVHLWSLFQGDERSVSPGNFLAFRSARSLAGLAARFSDSANLTRAGEPVRVVRQQVSADYFAVLGATPHLGRTFRREEDRPGSPSVAILSYGLWREQLARDPKVLERQVTLNGVAHAVIGVMPDELRVLRGGSRVVWVPLALPPDAGADYGPSYLQLLGRLRPGVSLESAQAEVDGIAARLEREAPEVNAGKGARLEPLVDNLVGGHRKRLTFYLAAVGCVLLIGCVNVANLLLARGAVRRREMAIRASLGAGRWRLVRQLLTESAVLGLVAAVVGLGLAWALLRALVALAPPGLPRLSAAGLDGPTVAFALVLGLAASFLFGLFPALSAARADLQAVLKDGGRGACVSGRPREWLRGGLLAAEVAVTLLLLVAAGLFVQSSLRLGRLAVGFDTERLLTARVTLPPIAYPDLPRIAAAFERIVEEVGRAPGTAAAAGVSILPISGYDTSSGLTLEGRPHALGEQIDGSYRVVTPGYLRAMRIELVAGQDFTARDREGAPRKAIVNQRLASLAWPGENPLGKRFSDAGGGEDEEAWLEVVGVAADVRSGNLGSDSRPEFYVPLRQTPGYVWNQTGGASLSLVVRARRDPATLAGALRRAVAQVDADLPVYDLMTMDDVRRSAVAPSRFNGLLLTALGLVGLALALVGIFGVVSYLVTQRTQEIGLRMALGATRGEVLRLVLGQAFKPVAAGLVLGLAGAALVGRSLAGWLYGIEPAELGTFAVLGALLATAALLAAWAPARRATGVDPSRALAP